MQSWPTSSMRVRVRLNKYEVGSLLLRGYMFKTRITLVHCNESIVVSIEGLDIYFLMLTYFLFNRSYQGFS